MRRSHCWRRAGLAAIDQEAGIAFGDLQQDEGSDDAAQHLGNDIGQQVLGRGSGHRPTSRCSRPVEVRAGDVPERIGTGQYGQAEGQGNTDKANTQRIGVTAELRCQYLLPQPPKTNQKVPRNSAAKRFPMLMMMFPMFSPVRVWGK